MSRAYRRVGERYADTCVIQRRSLGGGSIMILGNITGRGRIPLGNLTGICYRNEIVQLCYSFHPSSGQQRHIPAVQR